MLSNQLNLLRISNSLLNLTQTGIRKSILDATFEIRSLFKENNFHNYDDQIQGSEGKVLKKCFLVTPEGLKPSLVSLYRPNTKNGDPRMWISSLGNYARPDDRIILFFLNGNLFVINTSDTLLFSNYLSQENLDDLLAICNFLPDEVSVLLEKMKVINSQGFVERWGPAGPVAVGWTLEHLLGIEPNADQLPDFRGIEIKAHRKKVKTRFTIFSKTPDWSISSLQNAHELIASRGKFAENKNRMAIYCSISADKANSYGLKLKVDSENELLHQVFLNKDTNQESVDVTWTLRKLYEVLVVKHPKTFWVSVNTKKEDAMEYFHYTKLKYTSEPDFDAFKSMLETGLIEVDYTMHIKPDGSSRDHGYLFKIWPKDVDLLFKNSEEFNLNQSAN